MAEFDDDLDLDPEQDESDTARDLTSGIVITTTILLLGAMLVMFMALNKYFAVGPFAG